MAGRYSGPSALSMAHRLRYHGARALALSESDPVRTLGLQWYALARQWCADLAERYASHGATLESVAGAVAALSPQVSWLDQTRFVPGFLESVLVERDPDTLPHPGFTRNRARARDILLGADPESVLGGPKVTAFYACIMGDASRVCVDRHAATVALGARTRSLPARLLSEIREAYALAADWLGLPARDLQSLIWCDHKARGLAARDDQATFFESAQSATILDLALGWSVDPERAFHAPEPAADPSAPNIPSEQPEPESLPF